MGAWGRRGGGGAEEDDGEEGAGGARRFWACQMLHDALQQAARAAAAAGGGRGRKGSGSAGGGAGDVAPEEVSALLVAHRAMLDARGGGLLAGVCAQGEAARRGPCCGGRELAAPLMACLPCPNS
jgi:hypothetical protein